MIWSPAAPMNPSVSSPWPPRTASFPSTGPHAAVSSPEPSNLGVGVGAGPVHEVGAAATGQYVGASTEKFVVTVVS